MHINAKQYLEQRYQEEKHLWNKAIDPVFKKFAIKCMEGYRELKEPDLTYESFEGTFEYVDNVFYGKISNITDLVTFESHHITTLFDEFEKACEGKAVKYAENQHYFIENYKSWLNVFENGKQRDAVVVFH